MSMNATKNIEIIHNCPQLHINLICCSHLFLTWKGVGSNSSIPNWWNIYLVNICMLDPSIQQRVGGSDSLQGKMVYNVQFSASASFSFSWLHILQPNTFTLLWTKWAILLLSSNALSWPFPFQQAWSCVTCASMNSTRLSLMPMPSQLVSMICHASLCLLIRVSMIYLVHDVVAHFLV